MIELLKEVSEKFHLGQLRWGMRHLDNLCGQAGEVEIHKSMDGHLVLRASDGADQVEVIVPSGEDGEVMGIEIPMEKLR